VPWPDIRRPAELLPSAARSGLGKSAAFPPAFVSDGVSCVDQKRTPHNLRPIDCSGRKPQGTRHTCMAPVCD
jgi:hypothetical protein